MTISVLTEAISLIKFFLTVDHVASGRLGPSVYYIWLFEISYVYEIGFPNGSVGKESTCNTGDAGDVGSIPGSGRSPGDGNG